MSMRMLYRALIRSRLDYGCEAYDSACNSLKAKLDSVQCFALRLCVGALHTTPLHVLQVMCEEWPLYIRRRFRTFNSAFKLKS